MVDAQESRTVCGWSLISSVVMDSPLWGVIREEGHNLPLWHIVETEENFVNTCDVDKWIQFYYNPGGSYGVWDISSGFPSAAMIFWSWLQNRLSQVY